MRRSYIIEQDNDFEVEKNPVVTEEVAAYFAKKRDIAGKSDWANSPVSRRNPCRHCNGTGVLSHDRGSKWSVRELESPSIEGVDNSPEFQMVREPKGAYKQACVCAQRNMDKLDNLNIDELMMGEFH